LTPWYSTLYAVAAGSNSKHVSIEPTVCIEVHGESLQLLRERAIFWPATRTLIVADIHFGKAATFRRHGIPIPEGDTQGDLERLTSLVRSHGAERLLIAGDLLHAASSKSPDVCTMVQQWRAQHSQLSIVLVSGNHDKSAGLVPEEWRIDVHPESLAEPPFVFIHDPAAIPEIPEAFYICGHLHPAVALAEGSRMRALKAPCFWQTAHSLVLPGFGKFTGSIAIRPAVDDRVFAITRNGVVAVPQKLLNKDSPRR
jgi:DNA ligase-associated metallophosphoesterase